MSGRRIVASGMLVAALALGAAVPARAQGGDVRLDVSSGQAGRLQLRVAAFTSAGEAGAAGGATQAGMVLASDLQQSAVFAVSRAWEGFSTPPDLQAEAGGKWTVRGTSVVLEGEVHDWPARKPILAKTYRGTLLDWRRLVHAFADDIVLQFTGEPGIADTRIAFIAQEGRDKELWVMDADGAGAHAVTHDGSLALLPAWSPDGSLLLFSSYRGGKGPQLWVTAPESRKPFLVSGRPGLNSGGAYSPDGRSIACTLSQDGNAEIYRLDARGGSPERLTTHRAIDTAPCWAPTGREIAFTSDRTGTPQVYVMDADGGNVRRLVYDVNYTDSPAWSPKGDRIAFVSRTDSGFDIWVCRPDGSGAAQVVSGGANENPHWSPDGRHLVFASDRDGTRGLYVSDLDGGTPRKLDTAGHKSLSPAWSPRGAHAAPH